MTRITDTISPDTMLDLHEAAKAFGESIAIPFETKVGKFAASLAGTEVVIDETRTLITGNPDSLAINVENEDIREFINVDLPENGPAVIVEPGLYVTEDEPDKGVFKRMPVRTLTEDEGRALVADIYQLIAQAPASRLRTK